MQHPPRLARGLVTQYFGEALRIVLPFALHCNPHHLVCAGACTGDAFKSKAHRLAGQCGWQFNFFLYFALGRNAQQQVFRGVIFFGRVTFRRNPETAIGTLGNAFCIKAGRFAAFGDGDLVGNERRGDVRINLQNAGAGVGAVRHCPQAARLLNICRSSGDGAPGDGRAGRRVFGHHCGVVGRRVAALVNGHRGACCTVRL